MTGHGDSKSACIPYHTISSDLDVSSCANSDVISQNTTRVQNAPFIAPLSSAENKALTSLSACCGGHPIVLTLVLPAEKSRKSKVLNLPVGCVRSCPYSFFFVFSVFPPFTCMHIFTQFCLVFENLKRMLSPDL